MIASGRQTTTTMSKEQSQHQRHEPPSMSEAPRLLYRYEDGYDAEIHPTFASLSEQFHEYAEGPFAAYNVPVWIEYDSDADLSTVTVGLILTRHGICMMWRSPATAEEYRQLQARMLVVWATRADTGFGRFMIRPSEEQADAAGRR